MKGSIGFQRVRRGTGKRGSKWGVSVMIHRFTEVENGVCVTLMRREDGYAVTHARSGMAVARFETLENAKAAWSRIVNSGLDFTLPARIIVKQSAQHESFCVREIRRMPGNLHGYLEDGTHESEHVS